MANDKSFISPDFYFVRIIFHLVLVALFFFPPSLIHILRLRAFVEGEQQQKQQNFYEDSMLLFSFVFILWFALYSFAIMMLPMIANAIPAKANKVQN